MQLRDRLLAELLILVNIRPIHQRAVLSLHQKLVADESPENLLAYLMGQVELARVEAKIEFINEMLKEDEQV